MPASPEPYETCVVETGRAVLGALRALELAARRLHPPEIPALRAALRPVASRAAVALGGLRAAAPPDGLADFHAQLLAAAEETAAAAARFAEEAPPDDAAMHLLDGMRRAARAQEKLYPLRRVLPPVARFFTEPALWGALAALEPDPPAGASVGMHHVPGDAAGRGGFALYVPERYTPERRWPLVVALHGAFGHGDEFLFSWLREARSRGCLLLAPTSRGTTWSMNRPDVDGPALRSMVEFVATRWAADRGRVLLTGLSDGGTYAVLAGLAEESPFTHLAPCCGVLHPANLSNGNLERARGRRIRWVSGALDWMFPVALARLARETLERAGADLVYREIADLSHTHPREENAAILEWLDPALALPLVS